MDTLSHTSYKVCGLKQRKVTICLLRTDFAVNAKKLHSTLMVNVDSVVTLKNQKKKCQIKTQNSLRTKCFYMKDIVMSVKEQPHM